MLERIDLTPAALRQDLAGARVSSRRLYSVAEVVSRAADLCGQSAELVRDNERRWRVFRIQVAHVVHNLTAVQPGPLDPRP